MGTENNKESGEISIERLAHFRCGSCGKWWSVGDAPAEKREWHCPWCGKKQDFTERNYA